MQGTSPGASRRASLAVAVRPPEWPFALRSPATWRVWCLGADVCRQMTGADVAQAAPGHLTCKQAAQTRTRRQKGKAERQIAPMMAAVWSPAAYVASDSGACCVVSHVCSEPVGNNFRHHWPQQGSPTHNAYTRTSQAITRTQTGAGGVRVVHEKSQQGLDPIRTGLW